MTEFAKQEVSEQLLIQRVSQQSERVCGTCKNKRVELYWHETGMGVKPCEDCKAN